MFKKLLLLVLSSTLLVGCSQSNKDKKAQKDVSYSETLKKAGDDMFDYAGANRDTQSGKVSRSLDPLESRDKPVYLLMPAVLLYITGSVSEIDGVDTENHVFEFGGDYEYDFGQGWVTQNIFLAINAKVNSDEGKIFFSGRERISQNGTLLVTSDVFIDINFDFDKN